MQKLVSIIIPAFNAERTIKRCIESILKQDYTNIEIIVINDGSIDNTRSIVEKMASKDPRIFCISQENSGVSVARNKGIQLSKGDFLVFIDSDDYLIGNCFEFIQENSFEQMIVFPISSNMNNGEETCITDIESVTNEIIYPSLGKYTQYCFNSPWSKVYSRKIICENKLLFDDKLKVGEDTIFNLIYLKYVNNIKCIDKVVYKYDDNFDSVMRRFNSNYLECDLNFQYSLSEYVSFERNECLNLARLKAAFNGVWRCFSQYWINPKNQISVKKTYYELERLADCRVYFKDYEKYRKIIKKEFPIYKNIVFNCIYKKKKLRELAFMCRVIRGVNRNLNRIKKLN